MRGTPLSRILVATLAVASLVAPVRADDTLVGTLSGQVLGADDPLSTVLVYAYQTAELKMERAITDHEGHFAFDRLPAGLYKIVAFKPGFVPAVVMLNRAGAELQQYVQLQLSEEVYSSSAEAEQDFWSVRAKIPGDVLRDLAAAGSQDLVATTPAATSGHRYETGFLAQSGMRQIASQGDAQVTGAQMDVSGSFRHYRIGMTGDFSQLSAFSGNVNDNLEGAARSVAFNVSQEATGNLNVLVLDNFLRGTGRHEVALQTQHLEWTGRIGAAKTAFAAQRLDENHFYQRGAILPGTAPIASRSWSMEGSYETEVSDRMSLQSRIRYFSRDSDFLRTDRITDSSPLDRIEMYGGGGFEATPSMVVEYGVYSTSTNGSLSLAPSGQMVLQMGPRWQATTAASYRVQDSNRTYNSTDFLVRPYSADRPCEHLEQQCFQVGISRLWDDQQKVSLSVVQRTYGETMRLYFNQNFFDNPESLYLVPGDSVPELQLEIERRLTPTITSRLETSLASGGGGLVRGAQRRAFENQVRYLVTSLDTHFARTSTGVFVAFHRLEQELNPLTPRRRASPEVGYERLQLLLTQDIGILHSLADNLAVQLDMEVSRGSGTSEYSDPDEILKRVMGAVAMKF